MKEANLPCRKKLYQKISFELKLSIIDQVKNGQISVNFAAEKYNISRCSINYWIEKYSRIDQIKKGMSKNDEISRLKERIEELEFIKDFQQDIIADLENITGADIVKKSCPETLAKEINKKKINRLK